MRLKSKTTATLLIAIFMISAFAVAMPISAEDVEYSFTGTFGTQGTIVNVEDDGTHITWTIDYPLIEPFVEETEGNGQMTVGLVIALDGDGNDPAYQIHNNDGSDHGYEFGMWLYSEYVDGWLSGTGGNNIPVDDSTLDWVSCTGGRYNADNPNGLFTISIDKSELGYDFHWALNLAIGTGFWNTYLTQEQMSCPDGNFDYFDWGTPQVDETIPNYEYAPLTTTPDAVLPVITEVIPSVVSINLAEDSVNFGQVTPGYSAYDQITVTHTGTALKEKITVELFDDTSGFYAANLKIDTIEHDYIGWAVLLTPDDTHTASLDLSVPQFHIAGDYTGTLVFWAEEVPA